MSTSAADLPADTLAALVPLNALKPESRSDLLKKAQVEQLAKGKVLFNIGDDAKTSFYVLEGEVHILGPDRRPVAKVVGGAASAQHPVAQQSPRKVGAITATPVKLLRVDSGLLDVMLTWDQTGSFEVGDLDSGAQDEDWMSRLLQTRAFQMVPPANLQAMFLRMRPRSVPAGETIIRQGDEGDFFYVIISGRCLVTRETGPGKPPLKLATLEVGAPFGEEALISDDRRNATVTALEPARLMCLAKEDFRQLLNEPLARRITLADAQALVSRGDARWLDVRLPSEYSAGHLPGAVNLPLFMLRLRLATLDSQIPWIVYCDSGRRSAVATFVLTQKGYQAQLLQGGWTGQAAP